MARVTVEDCVQVIQNRYELVLLAAQRARNISAGSMLTVDRDNDKNAVVALREIADQTINLDELKRHISRGVNRYSDTTSEDDTLLAISEEGTQEAPVSPFGLGEMTEVDFEEEKPEPEVETNPEMEEAVKLAAEEDAMAAALNNLPTEADLEQEIAAASIDEISDIATEEPASTLEESASEDNGDAKVSA